MVHVTGLAE
jgi:transposase